MGLNNAERELFESAKCAIKHEINWERQKDENSGQMSDSKLSYYYGGLRMALIAGLTTPERASEIYMRAKIDRRKRE